MGPTAAMALPPQIAVPVEIRKAGSALHFEHRTQGHANHHGEADAENGIDEAAASSAEHVVQVHAESESDHRSLQQVAGELFCALVEGVGEGKAEYQPQSERHRRRDKSAGGNRKAQEKYNFSDHATGVNSVAEEDPRSLDLPDHASAAWAAPGKIILSDG